MERIITINTPGILSKSQRDNMRNDVRAQLASQSSEKYIVLILSPGTTVSELPAVPEAPSNTEIASNGSRVHHVAEVETEDEPLRFVWLTREQTTEEQRACAVGHDDPSAPLMWAIEFSQLSEADQVKYAGIASTL
jgi:hypothetical protein